MNQGADVKASLSAATLLFLLPASAWGQQGPDAPPPHGAGGEQRPAPLGPGEARNEGHSLFISPMGEPFRQEHPDRAWFAQADTNHDGRLDRIEMRADAARFFRVLDRGGDGEIDPDDIQFYEQEVVPEVRAGTAGFGRDRRGGFDSAGPFEAMNSTDHPDSYAEQTGRQGAGRYSYLNIPEPITPADRNFNRGIDAAEFRTAADERFTLLDRNNDGYLTPDELPALDTERHGGSGGPHRRGRHGPPGRSPGYRGGGTPSDGSGSDASPQE